MDDQCLRCNNRLINGSICRKELKKNAIVTTCSHVLCIDCANVTGFTNRQSKNRQCLVCTQPLHNVDDAAETNLRPTEEYKSSVLCGLDPATIMECANSALSFWNYQMLQENMYQQHILGAMSKKYSLLNKEIDNVVNEANKEIEGLHSKMEDMSQSNVKLQQKNHELADTCRERGKKYAELRKGYEILKKVVQQNQQDGINEESAEQAVRSITANLLPGALKDTTGDMPGNKFVAPTHSIPTFNSFSSDHKHVNQPYRDQRTGSGSQYSGEASRMLPPPKPRSGHANSPMNGHSAHRTPLPGAFRSTAERSLPAVNPDRISLPNNYPPSGSGRHHFNGMNGNYNVSHNRQNSAGGYGGISSGMKVGGASADSNEATRTGYVPGRIIHHRHSGSLPTEGPFF